MNRIPLVDLQVAHAEVAEEVEAGFKRVIAETAFIAGEEATAFEREYAAFSGVAHCVGVANGTDALELALRAAGVRPGDEVVLPANTFVATAEAVARVGARCVLVDMSPDTYLMDVEAALAAVRASTTAIIPVHLYGQLAEVERLAAGLSTIDGVAIVEDAAQCQGATRNGHSAGSAGLGGAGSGGAGSGGTGSGGTGSGGAAGARAIASTSFYPGKNLGAYGDAGAVVTEDETLATVVRTLGNHGGLVKYRHEMIGVNSRLDGLQAVVLRAKLARLAAWNEARRAAAARYDALLADLDVVRPATLPGNEHVWHLYVIRVPGDGTPRRRDAVVAELNARGIGASVHYPFPVHLTPAFADLGYRPGAFPQAERGATEILSLPIYPQITADQQAAVVAALEQALRIA